MLDTSFEQILLKKLTHNGHFFSKAMPILKKKYFSNIGNQELFKLVKEYYGEYRNIPSLTELVASVKNVSNAEIRNEIIKSLQSISATEEVANIEFMCDETLSWVKDAMYMEALQIGSDGLMNKDDNLKLKAQKIMDERAKISIDSDLGLDLDDIDTMIDYYSQRLVGIRTQHKELNKRLGPGFLPGTLSLILAASGIGKSLLMTDLISGMVKKNKNILLVSLEMSDKEIMKRVHANAMDLPINSLIDLSKTEGELARINDRPVLCKEEVLAAYNKMKADGNVGKFFIKDYPTGSFSPLMLEQLVETYKIERDIEFDAIFVDYMGIMKSDLLSPSAGLYSYIKSIAEELRSSAKKMDLPIISASQLNRSATNNVDDADNSAVSDSMGSVMTADFMLFLLQNEEMKERKEIVCKITKNRFAGRTDTWLMNIDYEHMRFSDMLIQNAGTDISDITPDINTSNPITDFGIITEEKQKDAEEFAKQEIKDIAREDTQKLLNDAKPDPFKNDIDELYKELGI
jgi:replicative DNA helicase